MVRVGAWQVHWQFRASSSVLPPNAQPHAPTPDPAGDLVDLCVSREEDLQGFSAVEIWVGGVDGCIVLEEKPGRVFKYCGAKYTFKYTFVF